MRLFCAVFKHCVAFFLCKLTSHFVPFSSFMKSLIISKLTKDFFGLFFSGTNTVVCQLLLKTWLRSRTTTTVQQFRRIRRLLLKPYDFYNSEMHFPLFFATTILTLLIQVFSVFFFWWDWDGKAIVIISCSCLLLGLDFHGRMRVVVCQPVDNVENQEENGEENKEKAVDFSVTCPLLLRGSLLPEDYGWGSSPRPTRMGMKMRLFKAWIPWNELVVNNLFFW